MSHEPAVSVAEIEEFEVADLLYGLVERSLAVLDESTGRYRLLETVRQFAWDRLMEEEEIRPWRDRHLAFFTTLGEIAEPHLAGGDQQEWLERLNAEHDNLRAALAWGQEAGVASRESQVVSRARVVPAPAGHGTPALRNPSFRLDRRSQYSQDAETRKPDPARGRSAPTVPDRLRGLFKASSQ